MSATQRWIERCNGDEPMNDTERYDHIIERVQHHDSFSADDIRWVINYLQRQVRPS